MELHEVMQTHFDKDRLLIVSISPSLFREQDLMMEEFGSLWDPENFTFTYKMDGETYELYDEQQILYPWKQNSKHVNKMWQ